MTSRKRKMAASVGKLAHILTSMLCALLGIGLSPAVCRPTRRGARRRPRRDPHTFALPGNVARATHNPRVRTRILAVDMAVYGRRAAYAKSTRRFYDRFASKPSQVDDKSSRARKYTYPFKINGKRSSKLRTGRIERSFIFLSTYLSRARTNRAESCPRDRRRCVCVR